MDQNTLNRIIGNNITKYRLLYSENKSKMTQENLAELLNVSVSLISSLESNKTNKGISISNLCKISIILDVPIHKFFEVENEK